jgi:hypothetical protein
MSGADAGKAAGMKGREVDQALLWRQEQDILISQGSRAHALADDFDDDEGHSVADDGLSESFQGEAAVFKRFDAALHALFPV